MVIFDLRSDKFKKAVINTERRAERQLYDEKLVKCFVPNRVLNELDTNQNQLIFGRRGVGKTHTLKAFLGKKNQEGILCHYIDCTTFGSGIGVEGSPKNIGIRFFSKLLSHIVDDLLEDAALIEIPEPDLHNVLEGILIKFADCAIPKSETETFEYSEITRLTTQFLNKIHAERLILLIDEWAQIPQSAQPYFAEFLKRSMFANAKVTVKVGVVDYTYKLNKRIQDQIIGIERSADIFTDIYMDRFFVWDQDENFVESFFAEVLYNHLALEYDADFNIGTDDKLDIINNQLFTQHRVLSELCRASEGNARDFLVLFGKAYTKYRQQTSHQKIGLEEVHTAAIDLYRSDKYSNISSEKPLEDFLDHLVNSIIKEKKSRTFMIPYQSINHPILERLFSARILHPLNVEWSRPHLPGERYSLVTMDYGTYASFKGTRSEPHQEVFWDVNNPKSEELELVPIDDRRSIRQVVVEKNILDEFWAKMSDSNIS